MNTLFNFSGFYTRMAARADFFNFVEVGVHEGDSLTFLGQEIDKQGWWSRGGRRKFLTGVDHWKGEANGQPVTLETMRRCEQRLISAGLEDKIQLLNEDSLVASQRFAPASLDFVFLDSDHRYEHVRREIAAWRQLVRPGGIIAGHDILEDSCGVRQAVDEMIGSGNYAIECGCWFTEVK